MWQIIGNIDYNIMRYYFRIYQGNDSEDGDTVWTTGTSWEDAESNIRSEYHSINKLIPLYTR